jgi:hypothetical protein
MRQFVCTTLLVLLAATTGFTQGKGRVVDADNNGFPDAGVVVGRHWESLYAYDATGDWYWDIGDGRIIGSVADPSLLDQDTVTTCKYVNSSRGTFENDPFQDSGWIQNHITCTGVDKGSFQYLIVHKTDPRYTGNAWPIWDEWEYHALTVSGSGNLVRRFPIGE